MHRLVTNGYGPAEPDTTYSMRCLMPSTPLPSPQADGTPESLHKSRKPATDRADDRTSRPQPESSDEHLGAQENQVSETSAPAGEEFKDEPKQG